MSTRQLCVRLLGFSLQAGPLHRAGSWPLWPGSERDICPAPSHYQPQGDVTGLGHVPSLTAPQAQQDGALWLASSGFVLGPTAHQDHKVASGCSQTLGGREMGDGAGKQVLTDSPLPGPLESHPSAPAFSVLNSSSSSPGACLGPSEFQGPLQDGLFASSLCWFYHWIYHCPVPYTHLRHPRFLFSHRKLIKGERGR